MLDRLYLIVLFTAAVSVVYSAAMVTIPNRGFMKLMERVAAGCCLYGLCTAFFHVFGLQTLQTPLAALCASLLGLPGIALATFISLFP